MQSTAALLSETWSFLLVRWRAAGIGLLAFTMVLAVNQAFFARLLDANVEQVLARTGLNAEQFQEQLVVLLRQGADPAEVDRMLEALSNSLSTGLPSEQYGFVPTSSNAGLYFVIVSMPMVFASAAVSMVILFVSTVFFMLMALQDGKGAYDVARQLGRKILKSFLLLGWVMLRSFVWVPLLGIVLGALLLPRYALAPVLLFGGKHGVLESVSISYAKTKGYWLEIVSAWLIVSVVIILGMWVGLGLVDILSVFVPKAGFLVWLLVLELAVAFGAVFWVRMARAILLKPR